MSGGVLWGITPMPCILAYAVGVHPVGFTASPGGLVVVFAVGWAVPSLGVVSCAGVDELYEALPFRQCRAFFLKCRCGWAGWVSAWAGASLCGCCAVGGVCILCRSVVPVVVVRGVSCGAVRGLSRGLLLCGYICVRMGCKRLVEGFIMVCWCPNLDVVFVWLCGRVYVYMGLLLGAGAGIIVLWLAVP